MTTNANQALPPGSDDWALFALGKSQPPTGSNGTSNPDPSRNGNAPESGSSVATSPASVQNRGVSPTSGEGDNPEGSQQVLESLTLADLLKHPKLAAELNSWNDRTTNARLDSERPSLRQQLKTEVEAEVEADDYINYLQSLPDDERGRLLASDSKASLAWAEHIRAVAEPDTSAAQFAAQVYAAASLVRSVRQMIDQSGLPDDAKSALADNKDFVNQGMAGLEAWMGKVLGELNNASLEAKFAAEIETRWASERENAAARQSRSNPRPGVVAPGSAQPPRPDVYEADSSAFLSAFT